MAEWWRSEWERITESRRVLLSGSVGANVRHAPLDRAVATAIEREHKRFASDLHDGVCQDLAGITWMLESLLPRVSTDVALQIGSIADIIRRVGLDARRLALGLAPLALKRGGFAGALNLLKTDAETLWGRTVSVSVGEGFGRRLPLNTAVHLYRIAQEATANALRHSGAAHINISAGVCDEGLLLTVQDDGCWIGDPYKQSLGLGIASMVSRAEMLGGELRILPVDPEGTKVQVIVPRQCVNAVSATLPTKLRGRDTNEA
jgi:signal transduction histidine kinase